ncbi:MAG: coproporphyrinogen III oxidase [Candidatus Marinimicrobia bacterium]|nr:coproporphyrinogen III oxidase [Candidatus Neomarinimicrobiota bacterium]
MYSAGIYIHIPFCTIKCIYCDFYSITNQEKTIPRFISAIQREIEICANDTDNWMFDTIFIGGGTPSLLNTKSVELIINSLEKKFDIKNIKEFTIEVNPGEVSITKLKEYNSLGINRLSIGIQSLNPNHLKFLGRSHSSKQALDTIKNAQNAGFENINCDLIYLIPGQDFNDWVKDLNTITQLGPDHISAYTLTLEKGTELFRKVKNRSVRMPAEDKSAEWFKKTRTILNKSGYTPYEISNFSLSKKECIHNLHYWNIDPYLGFGPSAHSFNGLKRWSNIRSLDGYINRIESKKSPVSFEETLTKYNLFNEKIGFGLRMNSGVYLGDLPKNLMENFNHQLKKTTIKWPNCLKLKKNQLTLTDQGFQFADIITSELMI